jgi:hypothetical protein
MRRFKKAPITKPPATRDHAMREEDDMSARLQTMEVHKDADQRCIVGEDGWNLEPAGTTPRAREMWCTWRVVEPDTEAVGNGWRLVRTA